MRIFITGATGLIGRRVVIDRLERGDRVVLLSRNRERAARMFAADVNRNITVVEGDPAAAGRWQQSVCGCDAVIHLAGAGIADHRWTKNFKQIMVNSRVDSTHQIVSAIEQCSHDARPRVLINASAIGYYGDAGDVELDESSLAGNDFLAQLSVSWEDQAARAATLSGTSGGAGPMRVVMLRIAVVLDERGGALKEIMRPFRFYMGGPIASGRQWMAWIHWRDLVGLIDFALEHPAICGPLNACSPGPVRNRDFASELGKAMGRPSWLRTPRFALRIALGEVADAICASQRVIPAKAVDAGYVFLHPDLKPALESLLERDESAATQKSRRGQSLTPSADMNVGPPVRSAAEGAADEAPKIPRRAAEPTAAIKLLATDVDGTLLNSDGSLSQGVVQACRAAERAGCMVVLATARPPRGLRKLLRALDLHAPTINYNGAVIWNPIEERANFHESLSSELARRIVNDIESLHPDVLIGLEALDRWYVNRHDALFLAATDPEFEPDAVGALEQFLDQPITKINVFGNAEQVQPVTEMIRERYWQMRQVAVFLTDPKLIQITHPLVDKGIALQRIARRMGLAREQVMAIGDASNDMGMLEWAGFSVAVENAYPAVKQLAGAIVPSNDELGVARAIQRFVLAQR